MLGISQQAVSQAVAHLGSLVVDHGDGLRVRDRRSLLDRWLEEYAGPGGLEFGWYSLGPVGEQVAVMPLPRHLDRLRMMALIAKHATRP